MGALLVPVSIARASHSAAAAARFPGDAFHYTHTLHIDAPGVRQARAYTVVLGVGLVVEEQLADGSVRVRQTIDRVSSSAGDAQTTADLLGKQSTFVMHPDGTTSEPDSRRNANDPLSGALGGSTFGGLSAFFPPGGLEVGQTYETEVEYGGLLPGTAGEAVPVTTTFEQLLTVNGRPAAQSLRRTLSLTDFADSLRPVRRVGSATFDAGVNSTSVIDLAIGWPLKIDAAIDYTIKLASGQGENAQLAVSMDYGLVLDDQALVE